ncbi:LysR family transcriptional regulator [Pseudorhodoferax sp.]|uniref:LysR family transcriptional regulator n=1 Tax=Pseudorhodoferax sp. TaxID=1993553 RepID=UPI002DD66581|nr:LysR family transcriptional regulator [Pseudorhodoferax sp.]
MWDLNGLLVFVRVAETRSFTLAASALDLTPSAVSKAMTRLEKDLGVRLLHRTTRSVNLTTDGASFLERCNTVLAEIAEAEAALSRTRTLPEGRLRVQMPVGFGRLVVMPALLRQFNQRHPGIVLDVELSDRIADVVHEGLDAAVIIGPPHDARLIARRLCTLSFRACASPAYLAAHGEPRTLDDLDAHHCLAYTVPAGQYREWVFMREGRSYVKSPSGRLNVNNAESLLEAAVAGAGIVMLSTFITAEAVRSGALQLVLQDYEGVGPEVFVVYPPNRNLSARVRAFVDFLDALVPAYAGQHGL